MMKAVRKTVLEILILGVASVAVAFTANAVRATGSIDLLKNYFDKGSQRVQVDRPKKPAPKGVEGTEGRRDEGTKDPSRDPSVPSFLALACPYQEVTFAEAVAIFSDPNTAMGVNIFVDARSDDVYEDGHIPGAIQADHYRIEEHIDSLLDYVEAAEKVIVYCNGGDCEDSIFLCTDLLDNDVPIDKIHLYPGGWKEWTAHDMPVETGREQEEHSEPRPPGSDLERE